MSQLRTDYAYLLDPDRIATHPLADRSASRLMELPHGDAPPLHHQVRDLPGLLRKNDVVVMNNTRVVPARLHTVKATGGAVELLVTDPQEGLIARALARSSKALKPGQRLSIPGSDDVVTVVQRTQEDLWEVQFSRDMLEVLQAHGEVPLPPYLHRSAAPEDTERYQTVFAKHPGSSAAPTAGLHLDPALLNALREKGVLLAEVTLHVGPGTFLPVRATELDQHVMHKETWSVPDDALQTILHAKRLGGRVVAIGTTTARTLESAAALGTLTSGRGSTGLFIRPGYSFRVVDVLFTNFHLPESTLLMLVSALAGRERVLDAYLLAQRLQYRFFSYGDAMLVHGPATR